MWSLKISDRSRAELTRAGYAIETIDACTADLSAIDPLNPYLLVILGGPIGAYEQEAYPFLDGELARYVYGWRKTADARYSSGRAVALPQLLGASVYPGTQGKEIGWGPILRRSRRCALSRVARLLTPGLQVLHWHGDTFDLPANARHLAEDKRLFESGFRHRPACARFAIPRGSHRARVGALVCRPCMRIRQRWNSKRCLCSVSRARPWRLPSKMRHSAFGRERLSRL